MDENKALIRHMYERIFRDADLDALPEFFLPNARDREPFPLEPGGLEGFQYKFSIMRLAFPNGESSIIEMIAERDLVAVLGTFKGTQSGEYLGKKASGKRVTVSEIYVFRIEDGKVAEVWGGPDEFRILRQLED
jgi:predicted ester cyclase